jgi:hypothetical protein
MKKITFLFSLFLIFSFFGFSQIKIMVTGSQTDLSGLVHTINLDPNNYLGIDGTVLLDIDIQNNSGQNKAWRITRKKLTVPSDWTDYICISGGCYIPNADNWSTPIDNQVLLSDAEIATLNIHFTPSVSASGSARYRYYIGDGTDFEDSVDVQLNFLLGVKNFKTASSVSIAPNPAVDFVMLSLNGYENSSVKIIDILGNTIYSEDITNSKKIDVSDYKNGVYFVIIESSDAKIINRKLVIRH